MRVTCKHCGGAHPAYDCRKKSTAARKDVQSASYSREGMVEAILGDMLSDPAAGTQALPVDTNSSMDGLGYDPSSVVLTTSAGTVGNKDRQTIPKRGRGRPRTITDMKVYKAMKQREYRARKK